jgi:predicted mannosyl-3-phosphoglycerate phosphatase (HAD superfamily)
VLKKGADLGGRAYARFTALHQAARGDDQAMVWLLQYGVKIPVKTAG